MPTKRVPLSRATQVRVTPAAIEAFRRMLDLEKQCTCPPPAYPIHYEDCAACEEWGVQQNIIKAEMGDMRPWEAPVVLEPGSDGLDDDSDPLRRGSRARWVALKAALDNLQAGEAKKRAGRRR